MKRIKVPALFAHPWEKDSPIRREFDGYEIPGTDGVLGVIRAPLSSAGAQAEREWQCIHIPSALSCGPCGSSSRAETVRLALVMYRAWKREGRNVKRLRASWIKRHRAEALRVMAALKRAGATRFMQAV